MKSWDHVLTPIFIDKFYKMRLFNNFLVSIFCFHLCSIKNFILCSLFLLIFFILFSPIFCILNKTLKILPIILSIIAIFLLLNFHFLNNISKISKTCSLRSIERISVDFCFSSVLFYTSYVLCWWNLKERVGPKSIFNIIIQTVPLLKIFDPR